MKPFDPKKLEQQIRDLPCELDAQRDRQALARILQRYRQKIKSQPRDRDRRQRMFRRITKLSVAATLLIAAGLIYYFLGNGPQVNNAWADLVERIDAVDTCSYRMRVTLTYDQNGLPQGYPKITKGKSLVYTSKSLGTRMDNYLNGMFVSTAYYLKDGTSLTVIPALKRVQKTVMPQSDQENKEKGNDPRFFVKAFLAGDHEDLGASDINGVAVEGIKAINPPMLKPLFTQCTGTLWMDKATGWPYRLEFEGTSAQGTARSKMVYDQFQWGLPLEPNLFDPNLPADYKVTELNLHFTEDDLIKGLKLFSETTGRYPSAMDMQTVMGEFSKGAVENKETLFKGKNMLSRLSVFETQMKTISAMFGFYGKRVAQQQDAAYYGRTVTPADTNAVLVRWQQADGQVRVIYGDLHAETVSPERLKALENQ